MNAPDPLIQPDFITLQGLADLLAVRMDIKATSREKAAKRWCQMHGLQIHHVGRTPGIWRKQYDSWLARRIK